jgi:hypothetical protein
VRLQTCPEHYASRYLVMSQPCKQQSKLRQANHRSSRTSSPTHHQLWTVVRLYTSGNVKVIRNESLEVSITLPRASRLYRRCAFVRATRIAIASIQVAVEKMTRHKYTGTPIRASEIHNAACAILTMSMALEEALMQDYLYVRSATQNRGINSSSNISPSSLRPQVSIEHVM